MSANFTPEMDDYKDIKKDPLFIRFVLENFPLLTDDFDAMTYYGALCKVVDYLKKVIDNEKALENNMSALYDAYNQLQDYVNHYFDNLDIQTEINTKLDEMAEDGTLADIIAQYIQLQGILAYNSVADMKTATNLVDGSFAETYGYYSYGDGGNAKYKIRQVTNQDVEDDMFIIALNDEDLVAELVVENNIYFANSLGLKHDGSIDVSTKLNTIMQKLNSNWLENNDENTIVFEGIYIIANKVIIPPCVKLRNSGFVEFQSSVANDSTFMINYLSEDLPDRTYNKQQYLSGSIIDFNKGSMIKYTGDKTTDNAVAIEIGSRVNKGVDYPVSRYNIKNLTITNFTVAILHNSYNVYIGSYENVSMELNTTNIQFGQSSQIGTASNQGERFVFNNCLIGPSQNGVLFDGIGWETFFDNCSFDFCVNCFKQNHRDNNYWNKINVTNSHFEGFTKLGVNIGTNEEIFNINNSIIYNSENVQNLFDNSTVYKNIRDTLLINKYEPTDLNPEHFVSLDSDINLDNTLSTRTQQFNQFFINNNMINSFDKIEDGNISVAVDSYVGDFKVTAISNFNATAQIVTDNYLYTGHKSLLLTKTSANNGTIQMETDLKPLTNQTKIFTAPFLYNIHTSQQARSMVEFYDANDTLIKAKSSFEWFPSAPQKNTWSINPYGFFDNVPANATQYKIKLNVPNFGPNDEIGTQYKLGGVIVNKR